MAQSRVFCVGRNYAAHAAEMGADTREPPFFFMKPASALVPGPEIPYPPDTQDLHHEVELVLRLGIGGNAIPTETALDHIEAYAVGIDLTKRDRQAELKAKGQPWERAKAFDASAPISPFVRAEIIGHPQRAGISLSVNGTVRQQSCISDMIWKPAEIIAHLSTIWTLQPGDVIFTGTPAGVGALHRGDRAQAEVEGIGALEIVLT
ncbi:MAG: fumarylacetoacetate hydrolase family protein [Caulobacterales bacterium]|jgi:fumarylpyruvate hydrolase